MLKQRTRPPVHTQQIPQKQITRQDLLNSIKDEKQKPLVIHIEEILTNPSYKYKALFFVAGLLLILLILGDIIFIAK